jgi:hypothetical protein
MLAPSLSRDAYLSNEGSEVSARMRLPVGTDRENDAEAGHPILLARRGYSQTLMGRIAERFGGKFADTLAKSSGC